MESGWTPRLREEALWSSPCEVHAPRGEWSVSCRDDIKPAYVGEFKKDQIRC